MVKTIINVNCSSLLLCFRSVFTCTSDGKKNKEHDAHLSWVQSGSRTTSIRLVVGRADQHHLPTRKEGSLVYIRPESCGNRCTSQSRHRFLSSRRNWDSPPPHTQASVYPSPNPPPSSLVLGGKAHSLDGEGVGSQFQRGDRHYGTLGTRMYVLCGAHVRRGTKLICMQRLCNCWNSKEKIDFLYRN